MEDSCLDGSGAGSSVIRSSGRCRRQDDRDAQGSPLVGAVGRLEWSSERASGPGSSSPAPSRVSAASTRALPADREPVVREQGGWAADDRGRRAG